MDEFYRLGQWRVRAGHEDEFVRAWRALGDFFLTLPEPPGVGTLVRSVDDPQLFYSFGPWPSLASIEAMRANAGAGAMIQSLVALCEEARPGTYELVATAGA